MHLCKARVVNEEAKQKLLAEMEERQRRKDVQADVRLDKTLLAELTKLSVL